MNTFLPKILSFPITLLVNYPIYVSRRTLFVDILEEAREMAMSQHHGRTLMYTVIGTDWRPFGHPRIRRPIGSVVLDESEQYLKFAHT